MNLASRLKQHPLETLPYQHLNPLVLKKPAHQVKELTQVNMMGLELKVMVLEKVSSFQVKDKMVHRVLVADETGCILLNLFGANGASVEESQVLYINNAYTMVYKNQLVLVEGKQGMVLQIGQLFFLYDDTLNMSALYHDHH